MVAIQRSKKSSYLYGVLSRWPGVCLLTAAAICLLVWTEMLAVPGVNRCFDADDILGRYPSSGTCSCPDPLVQYRPSDRYWKAQHDRMVFHAEHPPADLDFAMVGDGLVEAFNGTGSKGRINIPEQQDLFAKNFERSSGADMQGIALGCASDTSTQLFFHLKNGMLHGRLRPKVWIVMVGMSDIQKFGCSKSNVVKGILNVAQLLADRRPDAKIVVHGLLPRPDAELDPPEYSLGEVWRDTSWINKELRTFVADKQAEDLVAIKPVRWHYMEMTKEFAQARDDGVVSAVNPVLLPGIQPSLAGYQLWADHVKAVVSKLL